MLVKIFKNKPTSSIEKTVRYLTSEKDQRGRYVKDKDGKDVPRAGATVLAGDPFLVQEIAQSLSFNNKYTAGVLSFTEQANTITLDEKKSIINDFERALFAGLENRCPIAWVEHTDKDGRLELNFVIANVDMQTQKSVTPYFHRADKNRVDTCQSIINLKHNLSDPKDPSRLQTTQLGKASKGIKNREKGRADTQSFINLKNTYELKQYLDNELSTLF